jgi:hypothetical protein
VLVAPLGILTFDGYSQAANAGNANITFANKNNLNIIFIIF